jgi:hypothetical protein
MSPNRYTPGDLLDLLAENTAAGRKLRVALRKNPGKTLGQYGVQVPPGARFAKPIRLPSPKKVRHALNLHRKSGFKGQCDEAFALLIVVIGAIPFVADGAR